jgi:AcrR family transcriptional regulator
VRLRVTEPTGDHVEYNLARAYSQPTPRTARRPPSARPPPRHDPQSARRTAERILSTSLELFNRFGEPNTSTSMIAGELRISPGNLYYHYPSKDELINTLFDQYARTLTELLAAANDVRDVEDAWFLLHSLFELIWQYRFFYRDLNHLLSRNRHLKPTSRRC